MSQINKIMKIKNYTIAGAIFLFGCTFQKNDISPTNIDIDLLRNSFKIKNLNFVHNKINNDFFSESLSKCLGPNQKNNLKLKNTYTIKFKDNIISNVTEYEIQKNQLSSSVNKITNNFLITPRSNFSKLCWEDTYTKPIYSKNFGTTLFVFSSNENYIFNSKNDSIKSTIENNPQDYYLDDIISIINNQ